MTQSFIELGEAALVPSSEQVQTVSLVGCGMSVTVAHVLTANRILWLGARQLDVCAHLQVSKFSHGLTMHRASRGSRPCIRCGQANANTDSQVLGTCLPWSLRWRYGIRL